MVGVWSRWNVCGPCIGSGKMAWLLVAQAPEPMITNHHILSPYPNLTSEDRLMYVE